MYPIMDNNNFIFHVDISEDITVTAAVTVKIPRKIFLTNKKMFVIHSTKCIMHY